VKPLFITQSVVVGLMGLALLIFPSDTAGLLFGTSLAYPMGVARPVHRRCFIAMGNYVLELAQARAEQKVESVSWDNGVL